MPRNVPTSSNTPTPNKVTKEAVTAKIEREEYAVWPNSTLTICTLTMQNGFHVTGESACVDPANFDAQVGQQLAYKEAFDKAWALEAYVLAQVRYGEARLAEAASIRATIAAIDEFLLGLR